MKNLFVYKSFIFFVFLLSKSQILSYINLPIYTFHTTPPKPEETLKLPYYNYFHDNNIYTLIDIGLPPQKVVAKLNFDDYPFFIYYNRCNIFSSYDLNISTTFSKIPFQHLLTDIYAYTYLVDDYLKLSDMETYKMTYLFSPVNNGTSEQQIEKLPYTCAEIGLKMPRPDSRQYKYSFIRELKSLNAINDYYFFIEYSKDNDEEGKLIIGLQPFEYNPDKYQFSQLTEINTVQTTYDLYWQLKFYEIYFNLNQGSDPKKINLSILDGGLNHNLNIIIAPYEFLDIIEREFFEKKNCKRNRLEKNYNNFDCASKEDIEDFPTIYFNHREFGYTFEISAKDVFIEYNGRYMCQIWFDMSSRNNWRFGKPFLKKYFFSYNVDKKLIGFYNMETKPKIIPVKSENSNIFAFMIILLLLMVVVVLSYYLTKKFCKEKIIQNKAQKLMELSEDLGINDKYSINSA